MQAAKVNPRPAANEMYLVGRFMKNPQSGARGLFIRIIYWRLMDIVGLVHYQHLAPRLHI
jgi:hypothetical protein